MSELDPTPETGESRPAGDDPGGVALDVLHETCYEYEAPVSLAHHLAYLRPLTDAYQILNAYSLDVDPAPAQCRDGTDVFGNACCHFTLQQAHRVLRVRAHARLRVSPRFGLLQP